MAASSQRTLGLFGRHLNHNVPTRILPGTLFQSNAAFMSSSICVQQRVQSPPHILRSQLIHAHVQTPHFCTSPSTESQDDSASISKQKETSSDKDADIVQETDEEKEQRRKERRKTHFLSNIMVNNKQWCEEYNFNEFNDGLTEFSFLDKQTPISTVLSCCDSRAPTSALGIEAPNEIFSVRNIGNQFCNSIGSFRYGLEVLKTPYAIIMGHTNCGAIRGAAADYRYLHTMVQQEVLPLVRMIRFADSLTNSSKLDEMPFDHRCNIYAEINVDWQINTLLDDYQINARVQSGKLNLIGMMFDVHNVYNKGYGRLHVVNINGDRDILSLRQHPLLQQAKQIAEEMSSDSESEDMVSGADIEDIEIAMRLFSYSSTAAQSSQFSNS